MTAPAPAAVAAPSKSKGGATAPQDPPAPADTPAAVSTAKDDAIAAPRDPSTFPGANAPSNVRRLLHELTTLKVNPESSVSTEPLSELAAAMFVGHLVHTLGKEAVEAFRAPEKDKETGELLRHGDATLALNKLRTAAPQAAAMLRVGAPQLFPLRMKAHGLPCAEDGLTYQRLIHEMREGARLQAKAEKDARDLARLP